MDNQPSNPQTPHKSRKQSGLVELAIVVLILGAFFALRQVFGFG